MRKRTKKEQRLLRRAIYSKYDTQDDFAMDLGYADGSIVSRVISGRRRLTPEQMQHWAKLLKCEPGDIFHEYEAECAAV